MISYEIIKCPTSENFTVFKVFGDIIYQIMSPKAYNIDTGEIEYVHMEFTDPVTAQIICDYLNVE